MRSIADAQPIARSPALRHRGTGQLVATRVDGQTAITRSTATSPLKLLVPRPRGGCAWAFASTFGGGLVAGDEIDLSVTASAGTALLLGTQASTKIYRSPHSVAAIQTLNATIADDAILLSLPDPVSPFATAVYEQRQRFELTRGASLVLLDWISSGRLARGERWAFTRYMSRNDIVVDGQHLVRDALLLDGTFEPIDAPHRMGRFDCYATLFLIGPRVRDGAAAILDELNAAPVKRNAELLASASPIGDGGAVLRVLGPSPQLVGQYLRDRMAFAWAIAGEDLWSRKF
ncbi:MAG TPA: urease accessory protein UreD [Tepidisphaeraceae bacterium]|jgi:urease accessory protein|nr:urease accessory protein UreD [Tepidisphaeraceae bacterium]